MTDSERIDALEREMKFDPFVLHDVENLQGPYRGLSLCRGRRTLREAIDSAFEQRSDRKNTEASK